MGFAVTAMRILDLGRHRRARIWIGDLPDVAYPSQKTFTHTIPAGREPYKQQRIAAVEVFVPLGPRSMYGLLGGYLQPTSTEFLRVDLSISSSNERLFTHSLAMESDEVRVGLPAEYADAVLAGVELAKEHLNIVAAGSLQINCAAHGVVGSCAVIYKNLAAILVKVFNAESLDLSDAELVKLFPATYG